MRPPSASACYLALPPPPPSRRHAPSRRLRARPAPPPPTAQACGGRPLTRSEYAASLGDLQREIRTLRAYAVAAAVESASAPPSAPPSKAASPLPGGAPGLGAAAAAAALQLPAPGAETRESAELSAYYLRVMLDVVRLANEAEEENVPLEFLCPLSTLIMHVSGGGGMGVPAGWVGGRGGGAERVRCGRGSAAWGRRLQQTASQPRFSAVPSPQDPVVLFESGHSFERQALEDWWANGHRMCPKTGIPLKSKALSVAPNVQLKEAINRRAARSAPTAHVALRQQRRRLWGPGLRSRLDAAGLGRLPPCLACALQEWLGGVHPCGLVPAAFRTRRLGRHGSHPPSVRRWTSRGDTALQFRPLLRLLSTASDCNTVLQVRSWRVCTIGVCVCVCQAHWGGGC